jgi:hypothetical protein
MSKLLPGPRGQDRMRGEKEHGYTLLDNSEVPGILPSSSVPF